MHTEVAIVGAGLAGLSCAQRLTEHGIPYLLLEGAERVGGRVVTDVEDGFRLDRGFQVLLDTYPEAQRLLDLDQLGVRPFVSGALVRRDGRFWRVADPWRAPIGAARTLAAPFVSLGDAWRMTKLRRRARRADGASGGSASDELQSLGFSEALVESFFRPFFGGVTLDPTLSIPSSWFLSLFRWFSEGSAVLPAGGMQAIPEQLASNLPPDSLRLSSNVRSLAPGSVVLESGEKITCRQVVVATDATAANAWLEGDSAPEWLGTTTVYFAAESSPVGEPILVLNGDGGGPVSHLCVLSDAQPSYAPTGQALISVSVLGVPSEADDELEARVRVQLTAWYGGVVKQWRLLRIDRVPRALPRRRSKLTSTAGIHVCGDHTATPSIQGSLQSGRLVGDAVDAALTVRT